MWRLSQAGSTMGHDLRHGQATAAAIALMKKALLAVGTPERFIIF